MLLKNANFSLIENCFMGIFLLPVVRYMREYGVTTFPQLSADIPVNMKLKPSVTTRYNISGVTAAASLSSEGSGLQTFGGLL